jgi:hypothetical protein
VKEIAVASHDNYKIIPLSWGVTVVSFKCIRKRTNRLQYSVCASARSNAQGIALRKLI